MSYSEEAFKKFIIISIAAHFAVLVFFNVKKYAFQSEDLFIKNAVRVDIVALPEKIEKPAVKPAKAKAPKKVALKKKKTGKKKKKKNFKKAQKNAIEELKALKAIQDLKKELEQKKQKEAAEIKFKGNKLIAGKSLTGLDQIQYDSYYSDIEEHLHSHWALPQWLSSANLKAKVRVKIDGNGNVVKKVISESSLNEIFDSTVMQTIDKASPFPEPPERMKGIVMAKEFEFTFPKN